VSARINLEAVGDVVGVEHLVQLLRVGHQAVLVSYVQSDRTIAPQVADVLVDEGQRCVGRPFRQDVRLNLTVFRRQIEVKGRVLRVRRPRRRRGKLSAQEEAQLGRVFRCLDGFECLFVLRPGRTGLPSRQTAGAHDVEAAEHVGMLHAEASRAVSPHGVTRQAAALAVWDRAVMGVDVGHDIVDDEILEVPGGHRARIH